MAERIYITDLSLDGQNRYRHRHVLEKIRLSNSAYSTKPILPVNGIRLYDMIALSDLRTVI